MSYTAWSVVFAEVPSATKWNLLGGNDAAFNDGSGIADDKILSRHFADSSVPIAALTSVNQAFKELGRDTLTGADTEMQVSFTAKKYLKIIVALVANASGLDGWIQFNGDSGANYAEQYSSNHGAQGTGTGGVQFDCEVGNVLADGVAFYMMDVYNPSGADKLVQDIAVHQTALTAATVPSYTDLQAIWNSSNQISNVRFFTDQAMKAGAELIVLGHD
jgi:hypothetical protein